jgi:hypothetical protein
MSKNKNALINQKNKINNVLNSENSDLIINEFQNIITNTLDRVALSNFFTTHKGERDVNKIYGYPKKLKDEHFQARIERQDIAKRIVEAYPTACWGDMPKIEDDSETQEETEFEKSFVKLCKKLNLIKYIKNLDILAGWGHYSVLLIGINDGQDFSKPLNLNNLKEDDILYLSPRTENLARISEFDQDLRSKNYGKPLYYTIKSGGYASNDGGQLMSSQFQQVHYTRVIHVAENALTNDVIGTPRLEPVYNRLIDLDKIVGGSAETFFLNSRGGMHLDIRDVSNNFENSDKKSLVKNMQDYTNSLTRFIQTAGMDVEAINHNIADPKNHFDVLISLISATTEIPKRILLGSEQGQLASTQDFNNFQERVKKRQHNYCEYTILRPIIDFFINTGVLPTPKNNEYNVVWQNLEAVDELKKAEISLKKSQAIASYVNSPEANMMIPPKQFMEEVLNLEYREDDLLEMDNRDENE